MRPHGKPRFLSGTTTLRQSNEALADDDPRKNKDAAPVEWHYVEGCPPNVESEKLFNFIGEAVRVCKALVFVNPDGMVFVDFRRSLMTVKEMYSDTELGGLYGAIWEMPYDSHKYSPSSENRILGQPLPPWLIRRGGSKDSNSF